MCTLIFADYFYVSVYVLFTAYDRIEMVSYIEQHFMAYKNFKRQIFYVK